MWLDLAFPPLFQVRTRIATLKSGYNLLPIGPRCLQLANLYVIMGWDSSDVVRFELWSLLKCQIRVPPKSAYNSLIYWS